MEFTGERYIPEVTGCIALEHKHRYLQACELVKGKDVLDIASGEGYGSAMLSRVARHVIGVDISQEAVLHAKQTYAANNLEYRQGSAADIPVPDASVDVVISFETIEHHSQHEKMLQEIKRILRPDGILYISSPDHMEYSEIPRYRNPYHVKELTRTEFVTLIKKYFQHYSISGQRVMYGSVICSEKMLSQFFSWDATSSCPIAEKGIRHALYLIAIASDNILPKISSGILEDHIENSEMVKNLHEETEKLLIHIGNKDRIIKDYMNDKKILECSLKEKYQKIDQIQNELKRTREELEGLYNSRSWRMTSLLRRIMAYWRSLTTS